MDSMSADASDRNPRKRTRLFRSRSSARLSSSRWSEPPQPPRVGHAEAPLRQPPQLRAGRYACVSEHIGELASDGVRHGYLVPLASERDREIDDLLLGAPVSSESTTSSNRKA